MTSEVIKLQSFISLSSSQMGYVTAALNFKQPAFASLISVVSEVTLLPTYLSLLELE